MADFQRAVQLRDSQPRGAKVSCDYLHSLFPDPVWSPSNCCIPSHNNYSEARKGTVEPR